jgi:hypothetical protein
MSQSLTRTTDTGILNYVILMRREAYRQYESLLIFL